MSAALLPRSVSAPAPRLSDTETVLSSASGIFGHKLYCLPSYWIHPRIFEVEASWLHAGCRLRLALVGKQAIEQFSVAISRRILIDAELDRLRAGSVNSVFGSSWVLPLMTINGLQFMMGGMSMAPYSFRSDTQVVGNYDRELSCRERVYTCDVMQ